MPSSFARAGGRRAHVAKRPHEGERGHGLAPKPLSPTRAGRISPGAISSDYGTPQDRVCVDVQVGQAVDLDQCCPFRNFRRKIREGMINSYGNNQCPVLRRESRGRATRGSPSTHQVQLPATISTKWRGRRIEQRGSVVESSSARSASLRPQLGKSGPCAPRAT